MQEVGGWEQRDGRKEGRDEELKREQTTVTFRKTHQLKPWKKGHFNGRRRERTRNTKTNE